MKLLALMKKEFHRFFHDPRLIVTILLPGIVIFLLYNVIGSLVNTQEKYDYKVYVAGDAAYAQVIKAAVEADGSGSTVELVFAAEEEGKAAVQKGEASALLVFSENFTPAAGSSVQIWYGGSDESLSFYNLATAVLQGIAQANTFSVEGHSFEPEENFAKMFIAGLLPFLVVTFVFSACMSVTLESVAGEKERGTLATILATSVKRSHIALGKVIPLSCISAIGAASSFCGVVFSLPKLMGADLTVLGGYGFGSYVLLFLLILSFVPLIVSAIATVSTLSRSVKEASGYTSVVMILVMLVSIVSMVVTQMGDWVIAVPVLNAVVFMGKILGGELAVWQSLASVAANLVYTVLLVWLISRMLSSERVMFGK